MKNPANTSNGITMGTTNAEAASGVGVETPIRAPTNNIYKNYPKKDVSFNPHDYTGSSCNKRTQNKYCL